MSSNLSLNSTRCSKIERLICEFQRRFMMSFYEILHKTIAAILCDFILACIAITSSVFTRFQQFYTIAMTRLNLFCALLNYNHDKPPSLISFSTGGSSPSAKISSSSSSQSNIPPSTVTSGSSVSNSGLGSSSSTS